MPPKAGQLRTGLRSGGCSHVEKMNKLRRPKAGPFFGNDLEDRVLGPPLCRQRGPRRNSNLVRQEELESVRNRSFVHMRCSVNDSLSLYVAFGSGRKAS